MEVVIVGGGTPKMPIQEQSEARVNPRRGRDQLEFKYASIRITMAMRETHLESWSHP